jgi:serine/threonine protein kinase
MSSTTQDVKTTKEVLEQAGSSNIKGTDLTYVLQDGVPKELGKGGCGKVYLGTYRQVEGHVAIKELFMNNAPAEMVKEFANEASVMEKLRSDYLVQFYGYCLSPKYCLVMEFMPEGSLFQLLHSKKPLDWGIRYQISIQMSLGLEYLHDRNILHRDIKSLNVLLKNGRAKLSDFGQSKIKVASSSGNSANSIGTIRWKAPELFDGEKYTQKSDIYSLGMTFWEIASRQIPFLDKEDNNIVSIIVSRGIREEIPPDCPKKFSSLIFSCWKGEGPKADKRWLGNPADRPTARQITDYLRSNADDFETFISPKAVQLDSGLKNNLHSSPLTPQPNDQNNVASGDPAAKPAEAQAQLDLKVRAEQQAALLKAQQEQLLLMQKQIEELKVQGVKKPEAPTPAAAPPAPVTLLLDNKVQVEAKAQEPTKPKVDAAQLKTFLEHIAWGRQEEAEALLKANKELAFAAGDVTDHAKRTFRNITGFQLAVWNLDWHMWTMILGYLSPEAAKEQAQCFKTGAWVKEHSEHANWKNVINALQVYIDKFDSWNYDQRRKHWVELVGGTQYKLPVHVLQEYNNPGRPFDPCPKFDITYKLERGLPDWLSTPLKAGAAFQFGIYRAGWRDYGFAGVGGERTGFRLRSNVAPADQKSLISLLETRLQQRGKLERELLAGNLIQYLEEQKQKDKGCVLQ